MNKSRRIRDDPTRKNFSLCVFCCCFLFYSALKGTKTGSHFNFLCHFIEMEMYSVRRGRKRVSEWRRVMEEEFRYRICALYTMPLMMIFCYRHLHLTTFHSFQTTCTMYSIYIDIEFFWVLFQIMILYTFLGPSKGGFDNWTEAVNTTVILYTYMRIETIERVSMGFMKDVIRFGIDFLRYFNETFIQVLSWVITWNCLLFIKASGIVNEIITFGVHSSDILDTIYSLAWIQFDCVISIVSLGHMLTLNRFFIDRITFEWYVNPLVMTSLT